VTHRDRTGGAVQGRSDHAAVFTVGIPTLQLANQLSGLLELYCNSETVGEVLVVNNAVRPIAYEHEKLRVLQQTENIYVNPAWNLIARHARFPYLAFSNDDILFDSALLPRVRTFLMRHRVGIVGPHRSCFTLPSSQRSRFSPLYGRSFGFGTLMFMPRRNYTPIPEHLKIWYGDDWLFASQRHRNWCFRGEHIATPMGATSASVEFASRWDTETEAYYADERPSTYDRRFGWESRVHRTLTRARDTLIPSGLR
jgi:hypothetical protein